MKAKHGSDGLESGEVDAESVPRRSKEKRQGQKRVSVRETEAWLLVPRLLVCFFDPLLFFVHF